MFFDTNVLVRARFEAAPRHLLARRRMSEIGRTDEPLRISRQVLREYLATVTRPQPWSVQIPMEEALEHVARLTGVFGLLEDGPGVTDLPSGRSAPFLPMGPASARLATCSSSRAVHPVRAEDSGPVLAPALCRRAGSTPLVSPSTPPTVPETALPCDHWSPQFRPSQRCLSSRLPSPDLSSNHSPGLFSPSSPNIVTDRRHPSFEQPFLTASFSVRPIRRRPRAGTQVLRALGIGGAPSGRLGPSRSPPNVAPRRPGRGLPENRVPRPRSPPGDFTTGVRLEPRPAR